MTASADGSSTPFSETPPFPDDPPSPSLGDAPQAPGEEPPTEVHSPLVGGGSGDACPACGKPLAPDQRYCLNCGHRRGDPRLPFMDAVVFMEAINKPQTPPPPPPSSGESKGISTNTALIAGIATLVLAIGVGVLIGRSGNEGSTTAQAPQIIRVGGEGSGEGSGGAEEGTPESSGKGGGKSAGGGKKANSAVAKKAEKKSETGASGQTKATEEVLEPKVPQAEPEAQVGESCKQGTAGCSKNGKFEGNFFGE